MNDPRSSATETRPPRLVVPMILAAIVFTSVGLAGGWYASHQSDVVDEGGHDHGAAAPAFDVATLRNLDVEVGAVQPTSHTVYSRVPARITATPFTEQPIHAPVGGRVEAIHVVPGQKIEPGAPIVTLVRAPLPRLELTLTSAILQPASEEIHDRVANLREASQEIAIVEAELERVSAFSSGALPRQTVIDLEYSLMRAKSRYERYQHELEAHGFSEDEVESVAKGGELPQLDADAWKQALQKNGLWPQSAAALYAALPEKIRTRLWTVSSVGELAARGLDSDELTAWLASDPAAGRVFPDIASLLQRGHSVDDARQLFELGALQAKVTLRAPTSADDWDVHDIDTTLGDNVEVGATLVHLINPRSLYLSTEPSGSEKQRVLDAASTGATCSATPLVEGSGPKLEGLSIRAVTSASANDTVTILAVDNQPVSERTVDGAAFRTWSLRPGLRYELRLPSRTFENVYVVPIDAIAEQGAERVIYVPDGDSFRSIPVEISFSDHDVAVIPINQHTQVFPGDRIVLSGAFSLGLALSGGGGIDPHAGHSH